MVEEVLAAVGRFRYSEGRRGFFCNATGETTSHLTGGTTSHSTRLSKDDNQVAGYKAERLPSDWFREEEFGR
jgi:hypothetical protein